ncbi:hypothetical protein C8J57DRAFT_217550 [Mycena rebaudengoi]|nr:hypothetical protein C8J57DRAFT_217550 [Mycena rebaudengoi]
MFSRMPATKAYVVKNKTPLPEGHLSVVLNASTRYLGRDRYLNEEQNVTRHSANICFDNDVESENPTKIGKIDFTFINRSRMMNGLDGDSSDGLFESCDAISHELMMMYSILFDEEGEPRDSFEEQLQGDILYLDSIEIEPRFRGYGIGLLALDGLRGIFPSFEMDVILLNPAGLTSEVVGDPGSANHNVVQKKLIAYWSLLGMAVWAPPESDFKLMGMWTGYRLPHIEEVVPHLFK